MRVKLVSSGAGFLGFVVAMLSNSTPQISSSSSDGLLLPCGSPDESSHDGSFSQG